MLPLLSLRYRMLWTSLERLLHKMEERRLKIEQQTVLEGKTTVNGLRLTKKCSNIIRGAKRHSRSTNGQR